MFAPESTNFTQQKQFTSCREYVSVCENSCIMFSVALKEALSSLKKKKLDDVIRVISPLPWRLGYTFLTESLGSNKRCY